ncbi:site-2 protease family protein [Candidatus Dojkabacteria bacterium]|jgi:Zn-dependent protease|nr:site-2 protease family protein [Candidatus Dojkabacteria bacterium]
MSLSDNLLWYIFAIPALIIASTIHEYAHAFVAYKLGDATAKANGRLSLNPLSHIDPIGAISMIIFRIGWSKPVPINEYNFKNPVWGTALVSIAGPLSNVILAIIIAILYKFFPNPFFYVFIIINISMGVFNLIPIPPLDGSKIVRAFLPKGIRYFWEKLERFVPFIFLLFLIPFSPLSSLTSNLIGNALDFFLRILGIS